MDIIDYRGGKALIFDSLDITRLRRAGPNHPFRKFLRRFLPICRTYVDWVLVITSYDWESIPSLIRDNITPNDPIGGMKCYRVNLNTPKSSLRDWDTLLGLTPSGVTSVMEKTARLLPRGKEE